MRPTLLVCTAFAALLSTSTATAAPRQSANQITIVRDEYGVPHVYADSLEGIFYADGYAQAQDRLWQAEIYRRVATGTLAEWFGPSALAGDVAARTAFGPPSRRAALLAAATPEVQTAFASFAAGMNAWIVDASAQGALPAEYAAFGVAPRPWTEDDSLAVFMYFASRFGLGGASELDNAQSYLDLVTRLGPADGAKAFADTHWLDDPSALTTDPRAPSHPLVSRAFPRGAGQIWPQILEAAGALRRQRDAVRRSEDLVGIGRGPASNAVVLSGRLTRDGHPLLLGGPQMGYSAPQVNHEIGLHGAGFDVTGMEVAGWPLTPIGVTARYAWSLTTGGTDNSDLFAETLDPTNPGTYFYDGAFRPLDCRTETFYVFGAPTVTQTICASVHGPIIASAGGIAYALQDVSRGRELQAFTAWLDLARARSLGDFQQAVSGLVYNFNVFYADVRGNIAHFHAGLIPVRAPGVDPWLPTPGDGSAEWQGFVPFAEMPHAINPRRGWLASWNNKPKADWPNSTGGFFTWGPVQRYDTLVGFLERIAPHSADVSTLEALNRYAGLVTDTPSGSASTVFVSTLLGRMLDAVDTSADPRLAGAVALLSSWDWLQNDADGDGYYDSPAVAVFNTWWDTLIASVFYPTLGAGLNGTIYGNVLARLFDGADAALPPELDYLAGTPLPQAVTAALVTALDTLSAEYGTSTMSAWLEPRATIFWSPMGIGSVPNTLWMNRGTYNQIVHLGGRHARGRAEAENVVSPGQSGDYRSPHFADQLPLYATWRYKPMRLTARDLAGHVESVTRLTLP